MQPRIDAPLVEPDLIIAPLLGFDRSLNRSARAPASTTAPLPPRLPPSASGSAGRRRRCRPAGRSLGRAAARRRDRARVDRAGMTEPSLRKPVGALLILLLVGSGWGCSPACRTRSRSWPTPCRPCLRGGGHGVDLGAADAPDPALDGDRPLALTPGGPSASSIRANASAEVHVRSCPDRDRRAAAAAG
jgi:hypothetical protein